jgi:hypothetical protein
VRKIKENALKALRHAMQLITCSSRIRNGPHGKPGELIELLPKKDREALQNLTSDMMLKQRIAPWEREGLGGDPQWLKEEKEKLTAEMHKHGNEI